MRVYKTCICVRSIVLAKGLTHYIHAVAPVTVVEYYKMASELLSDKSLQSPIIFLDLQMLTSDSGLTLEKIKLVYPDCILVGITDRLLNDRFIPYLDHIIPLDETEDKIVNILRLIYQPESNTYSKIDNIQIISERECEILKYVALGFTNKEISDKLCISVHTVITHRKNITFKLGIKTIAGLTVYAILKGIISAEEI
jgi:DNA-binding NarL/FixJ family response regulator